MCGLDSGATIILARAGTAWAPQPNFIAVPKMMPDSWLEVCCFCLQSFSKLNRRHHCRRCGVIICGGCSERGAPRDSQECSDALAEMRRSTTRRISVCLLPHATSLTCSANDMMCRPSPAMLISSLTLAMTSTTRRSN